MRTKTMKNIALPGRRSERFSRTSTSRFRRRMVNTMKPSRKITGMAVMMAAIFALFTPGNDAFGQLDPTFHPPFFAVPSTPARAQLLPDGKYLLFEDNAGNVELWPV